MQADENKKQTNTTQAPAKTVPTFSEDATRILEATDVNCVGVDLAEWLEMAAVSSSSKATSCCALVCSLVHEQRLCVPRVTGYKFACFCFSQSNIVSSVFAAGQSVYHEDVSFGHRVMPSASAV